jgi:cytochrome P450
MILAGHETTTAALAWAFALLAHHADARERLTAEVDAGSTTEYMTATIHEVLRHRPVFPFTIPREVRKEIAIGERIYEPPVHLLGCIYLAHHDPNVYPAPHDFRPERFLGGAPAPYAWLPWGGGHRRCPGHHLATAEMEVVLCEVLKSFDIAPASARMEGPRWRGAVVTPRAGARTYLRRRDRARRPLRVADANTKQFVL